MKKKVLCVFLALLLCLTVTVPAFADNTEKIGQERAAIAYSFGLNHVSGSTYNMHAQVINYAGEIITVGLGLFDSSDNLITSVGTISSNEIINLSKNVSLSHGTYYLRISVIGMTVARTANTPDTVRLPAPLSYMRFPLPLVLSSA